MNRNVNEHAFYRGAKTFLNAFCQGLAVVLVVGVVVGACMGCRALVIDTGQQIVHGK